MSSPIPPKCTITNQYQIDTKTVFACFKDIEFGLSQLAKSTTDNREKYLKHLISMKDRLLQLIETIESQAPIQAKRSLRTLHETIQRAKQDATRHVATQGELKGIEKIRKRINLIQTDLIQLIDTHLSNITQKVEPPLTNQKIYTRDSYHILRRLWHSMGGVTIALLYYFLPITQTTATIILGSIGISFIVFDFSRLYFPRLNHFFIRRTPFGRMMREHEKEAISTSTHFFLGSLFALIFLPKILAIIAVLFLAFGDPIASIAGIRFGRNKILWGKSIEGSIACALACTTIAYCIISAAYEGHIRTIIFSILSGLVAAVSEAAPLKYDDNITIPVISGIVMWLMHTIMF